MDNLLSLNIFLILSYFNVQLHDDGAQRPSHGSFENLAVPSRIKGAKAFEVVSAGENHILTKLKDEN